MKNFVNPLYWILVLLLGTASLFFTWETVNFKKTLKSKPGDLVIASGTNARFELAIDGDEFKAVIEDRSIVIRILGIRSFEASANDPRVSGFGSQAALQIADILKDGEFTIVFDEFKKDSKDRILAYVEKDGRDLGAEMTRQGLVMVYTEFKFSRMEDYLSLESEAQRRGAGLWGRPEAARRAKLLKRKWEREE